MAFLVGIIASLSGTIVGLIAGLIAGYYGGSRTDSAILGLIEVLMCIPFLPLMLVLGMLLGGGGIGIWFLILILAITGWTGTARIIRAQTLSLRERPFVDAAKVAGAGDFHIMFRHIAPNALPLALLNMAVGVAFFILTEATISFLGFGDPTKVSWGIMLNLCWVTGHVYSAPWWMIPPGLAICILSTGFYLMARGIEEILNPRLRPR
jgi:peptide/nickel transport system permease protein